MFGKKRDKKEHLDLDEAERYIKEQREKVDSQTRPVSILTDWLEARKLSNGFGDDFEWTLAHPRR